MEIIKHDCQHCGGTHSSEVMESLPVRSFSKKEVQALDSQDQFDSVTGLNFHECSAHPENAVATEQLVVEIGGEFIGLQHVSGLGWKVLARRTPETEEPHDSSVERTLKAMRDNAHEEHERRHHD